jgi:hypothetical protein
MAARYRQQRRETKADINKVFNVLRGRIGEELQRPGLRTRAAPGLELSIATFAPSHITIGFVMSDYPFIGARYVSVRDGHVYIVAGATDDGEQVKAYRLNFWQSKASVMGGIAVGLTPDGWMDSIMIVFSASHEKFEMEDGMLKSVRHDVIERRSYPFKKAHAYCAFLGHRARAALVRVPLVGRFFRERAAQPVQVAPDSEDNF